ncbi:acyl-CoA dehydrogenase family protein [Streptomyces sp. SJL17-1]|uniref:acyl-CoA dehydrogenase family protein n=1 Tax=Streptomyces sp. SJL17-1 TaxID=2967223 RepID=UPI002965D50F|nr:acyl-CoA dehydrogenase family protein [Streptomyces sp. SJL17-1]
MVRCRQAPRDFYHKLGELGIFGINVPEEFGGAGLDTHSSRPSSTRRPPARASSSAALAHVLLALPYIKLLATDEQKKRYLTKFVTGERCGRWR